MVYDAVQRQYTSTSPLNRQRIVTTDLLGRPVEAQLAGIEAVNYAYDARGRLAAVTQGSGFEARSVEGTIGTIGSGFAFRPLSAPLAAS